MPVMDEFREEREALKHGTPKEKFAYFMDYYKWHAIITVCVIVAVSILANQILTRKDKAFYVALVNGMDTAPVESEDDPFTQYADIDTRTSMVVYDTSMYIDFNSMDNYSINSAEKFVVFLASKEMDVVISGTDIIQKYAHNETFYDLREVLTEEQIEKCRPYFYYIDQSIVKKIAAEQEAMNYDFIPEYPDPTDPGNMEQPIPVGIYVTDRPALTDRFAFSNGGSGIVLSVVLNTTRPEMVSKYIDFLMTD